MEARKASLEGERNQPALERKRLSLSGILFCRLLSTTQDSGHTVSYKYPWGPRIHTAEFLAQSGCGPEDVTSHSYF